jgi:3-isopropylmalate dehydratase, small subunit
MEPFTIIKSAAIPLDRINVDTDQIVPKQFLKLVSKTGYGKYLFYDWRFDAEGKPRNDFVLNNPKYAGRKILLCRDNFGSGSSREHAAWALLDYGIRAVIAPSFADIFYNNCCRNGILPVRLSPDIVDHLFQNEDLELVLDLPLQVVKVGGMKVSFEIDEFRKKVLLEGLDSIGITLQFVKDIERFEAENRVPNPSSI